MKKFILVLLPLFLILTCNLKVSNDNKSLEFCLTSNNQVDSDKVVNEVLEGINENDFEEMTNELNLLFNNKKTLKERLIDFFNGDLKLDGSLIFNYFKTRLFGVSSNFLSSIIFVIVIGILCTLSNVIICKINDNTMKNTIFFICYLVVVLIIVAVLNNLFEYTLNSLNNVYSLVNIVFPIMFSLVMLIGNFGVEMFKPFTAFLCFFVATISKTFYIPLLSATSQVCLLNGVSDAIKLDTLKKSLTTLFKWSLGLIVGIFSILLTCQGLTNIQYNGISVKILKYASGTLIPVVGNFLSGGIDVLMSSSIIIKNSLGIFSLIYVLFNSLVSGLSLVVFSISLKFIVGISEPLLDNRFVTLLNSIADIVSNLSALIFLSGFMFIITILFVITSTSLVIG